jgi:DNA polymerase-3 subunit epsilon
VSGPSVATHATAYEHARPPAPQTPWREAEFCVIDLETTGLDARVDEIISFAALQIADGRLRLSDARYEHIRPRRMPDAETIRIHGLRAGDLNDAPTLSEVLDHVLEALAGTALVAHVASIETGFLAAALKTEGLQLLNPIIDTSAMAAELFRRRREPIEAPIGLSQLARALGLPVHRPHHADGDALTTAQVFLALATLLDRFEPQTVGSLQRCGRDRGWRALLPAALTRGVALRSRGGRR